MNPKKTPNYAAPAVDRMLDIMEFLALRQRPFGISELARELAISTNSVFRIIKRMTERGYAEFNDQAEGYQLSTRFFSLGMKLQNRFELRSRALPHLKWLCGEANETVQIHVPEGNRALVLDCIVPANDYYLKVVPGSRMHYHANAFGKAILAFYEASDVRRLIGPKLKKLTVHTRCSYKTLWPDLENVRRFGIACDKEEYALGIYCVGGPVFDTNEIAVAGAGITGLSSRFEAKSLGRYRRLVLECCRRISRSIGYEGDFYDYLETD